MATSMATEQAEPPPRKALKCPNGHTRWEIHDEAFHCPSCTSGGYDSDGGFEELWDQRTGTYVAHREFVDRWGTDPYE